MSVEVVVKKGLFKGRRYWVTAAVLRIGSDKSAQLCIPDLEPHAITLRFVDKKCQVYNRMPSGSLQIGRRMVGPGESLQWLKHETLSISDHWELGLELDGELGPSPLPPGQLVNYRDVSPTPLVQDEPDVIPDEEDDEDDWQPPVEEVETSEGGAKAVKIVLIIMCFLVCALMLAFAGDEGSTGKDPLKQRFLALDKDDNKQVDKTEVEAAPDLMPLFVCYDTNKDDVLDELELTALERPKLRCVLATAKKDDPETDRLIRMAQFAEAARVRGDDEKALAQFRMLRDELTRRGHDDEMLRYVQYALRTLNGP